MGITNPDYIKYADSCSAKGCQENPNAAEFEAALKLNKPCIIDATIDSDIYPPMSISKV